MIRKFLIDIRLEIVFTIAAPAFDILFIGCTLNTKIAYTAAEKLTERLKPFIAFKCCKMLLEDGEARRRRKKREPITNIFFTFSTNILCPCTYTPWDS